VYAELVKRNQGLNIAVARMAVGEVCDVEVAPEYGYGEKGSFSFPAVPGNATLMYRMELVAASPPADKPKGQMFFEERLEAAQRLRLQVSVPYVMSFTDPVPCRRIQSK
jgi:hypothetical protein